MRRIVLILFVCSVISACGVNESQVSRADIKASPEIYLANQNKTANIEPEAKKKTAEYLAYIHELTINVEGSKIESVHKNLINECDKDTRFECSILSDDLRSGDSYVSSNIQFRVKPEGVPYFSSLASQGGRVAAQSRQSEDLSVSIFDKTKRIEQLERYQAKLMLLEVKADADIDSLIKVASELANTQTELEFLRGSKAQLMQRVQTDILNIRLNTIRDTSFFAPIIDSFSYFGEEFSEAIAGLVSSIAYLLPWTVFLLFMFFIVRGLFRFLNNRVFRKRP